MEPTVDKAYIPAETAKCEKRFSEIIEAASMSRGPVVFTCKSHGEFVIVRSDTYAELVDELTFASEIDVESDPLLQDINKT